MSMKEKSRRAALCMALSVGSWLLLGAPAMGQANAPLSHGPIRLLVGFGAGGGTDTVARIIAEPLARRLNASIIVENRPGANGVLAMEALRNSEPDGRTLLVSATGTLVMQPHLTRVPFDIHQDITSIGMMVQYPLVIVTSATNGLKTLREFVQYVRERPGQLSYSSAGIGSGNHFAGEMLKHEAGIDLVHVPYKGDAPALPDLMEGRIAMHVLNIQVAMKHIESGKLTALALTGSARLPELPHVPTVAEAGYPDLEMMPWTALIGPAGLPEGFVTRVNDALNEVLSDPSIRKRFSDLGQQVAIRSPNETKQHIERENERYEAVARQAGMTAE